MKRAFDFVVALAALVILSPIMVAVGMGVLVALGRPVFFSQERPGLHGRPFILLKFRTMLQPQPGLADDKSRLTSFGAFLRSTSLDELPEFWNVLKGEMSLVGPRPLLMDYLNLYSDEQVRRHEVRPGITGWAQVNGRNILSWQDRFVLDVWYVDHQSLALDLKIILMTLGKVLKREGVSHADEATMKRFNGND